MRTTIIILRVLIIAFTLFALDFALAQDEDDSSPDDSDDSSDPDDFTTPQDPGIPILPSTMPTSDQVMTMATPTTTTTIDTTATMTPSVIHTDGNLTYVKDSGICETTQDVRQFSGYINISKDTHLWFWYFEVRTKSANAPLTIWVNGESGCSSMAGLFQEHGPCKVDSNGTSTSINPFSWNNYSNMIYIDLSSGAGFSYGQDSKNTFQGLAEQMWTAMQVLFGSQAFAAYRSRRLVFATEGFGARLAPILVRYFNAQNERIDKKEISGFKVVLEAIMVNNGMHDPKTQLESLIKFSTRAGDYGRVVNGTVVNQMRASMTTAGGCGDLLSQCEQGRNNATSNSICSSAWTSCESGVLQAAIGHHFPTDLFKSNTDPPYPSNSYLQYLQSPSVMARIGASKLFEQCNSGIKIAFQQTGDFGRSSLPDLAVLANGKFPTLVWAGDQDISENWLGVYRSMITMNWFGSQMLNKTYFRNITLGGVQVARAKVVGSLSFARVHGAGHAVAAYQPWVAQEIFREFATKGTLFNMLDQKPRHRHSRPPPSTKNGAETGREVRWLTVASVVGAVAVAVL